MNREDQKLISIKNQVNRIRGFIEGIFRVTEFEILFEFFNDEMFKQLVQIFDLLFINEYKVNEQVVVSIDILNLLIELLTDRDSRIEG